MDKYLTQSIVRKVLLPTLLFVAALLFFGLCYPHHLHFQEQYQMFLFDVGYMKDIVAVPGGVADLAGRFLTQFFLYAWVGATVMALLLCAVFVLSLKIARQGWFQGLSLLPVVCLWIYFCDENALLGAITAFLFALLADWGISSIGNNAVRMGLRIISAPLLYWAIGPIAVVTVVLGLISSLQKQEKKECLVALIAMLVLAVTPLAAQYCVAVPLERLYVSPHYHRYSHIVPYLLWLAAAAVVFVPLFPVTSANRWMTVSVWILMFCSGGVAVKMNYNQASEVVMSYDFMARFQQWNRIIDKANTTAPRNALSCTALNLALGMKGHLADRMFEFPQNGLAGLLPAFERDPVSPLTTSEAYYQLGMINTAQRYVFEAQEAIMDYQKSSRCFMRLAETNIISGNYEVARKYLQVLSKTLFYRNWAAQRIALLYDEEAIAQHPEYGRLRTLMPDQDYIFQENDIALLLGHQVMANGSNRLAYEYLQLGFLLNRDLESFASGLRMASGINYQQMPKMFQQGYVLWWSQKHTGQEKMPGFINPQIANDMYQFVGEIRKPTVNKERLRARYGNTYWFYYVR